MKIAFISTMAAVPWGGSEELWADAAQEALLRGHQVGLFLHRWPQLPPRVQALHAAGASVFFRMRPPNRPRMERVMSRFPFTWSALRKFRPDVACVSMGDAFDYGIDSQSRGLRRWMLADTAVVLVAQFLDDSALLPNAISNEIADVYSDVRAVAFVSEANLKSARRQLANPLRHGLVLRNPVNMPDRSPLPWPSLDVLTLASVARLEPAVKGHDVLFEALASPAWRERPWRLRLLGEGGGRGYLQRLAGYFGIAERVDFVGFTRDIRQAWCKAHVLVLPSRAEGTALAMVEAMLCARPVVATDVGGAAEWIEHGVSGFLAAAPTARSLGGALEDFWQARHRWESIGRAAHDAAVARFDPNAGATLLSLLLSARQAATLDR